MEPCYHSGYRDELQTGVPVLDSRQFKIFFIFKK
jgi:hypothetical protein